MPTKYYIFAASIIIVCLILVWIGVTLSKAQDNEPRFEKIPFLLKKQNETHQRDLIGNELFPSASSMTSSKPSRQC